MKKGVLVLHLVYPWQEQTLELVAVYPDEFPYFRPAVYASNLDLKRHMNPLTKELCLIGGRTEEWEPEDTLASYLDKRLPMVFADQGTQTAQGWEEQAAPDSSFFQYAPTSNVLVDGAWSVSASGGKLDVAVEFRPIAGSIVLSGMVLKVHGGGGNTSFQWHGNRPNRFSTRLTVPFEHIGRLEFIHDPGEQLAAVSILRPRLRKRIWITHERVGKCAVVAITFSEEIAANQSGSGWMFFLIRKNANTGKETVQRIRSYRAGLNDFGARVPAVNTLRAKKILLVGCGAVGAPIAIDLTRCGANMRLLDCDTVDPGPTIRWPLGLPSYGFGKSDELMLFLRDNYPYASVEPFNVRIGDTAELGKYEQSKKHRKKLAQALAGADLIVDASAEVGVQQYLSAQAAHGNIPYIFASATPGAVGGMVGRFIPGDMQGCWFCLQRAIYHEGVIPEPKKDIDGHVLPPGCNHPTFTGASFDLTEVSLQALRMTVQAFNANVKSAFVSMEFDGALQLPRWESFPVPRYDDCLHCRT